MIRAAIAFTAGALVVTSAALFLAYKAGQLKVGF